MTGKGSLVSIQATLSQTFDFVKVIREADKIIDAEVVEKGSPSPGREARKKTDPDSEE